MNNRNHLPKQSEIWLFDPDPVIGNELGYKQRPALIVSNNFMNHGTSNLVIVVPCTSKAKKIPSHICIDNPKSELDSQSFTVQTLKTFETED